MNWIILQMLCAAYDVRLQAAGQDLFGTAQRKEAKSLQRLPKRLLFRCGLLFVMSVAIVFMRFAQMAFQGPKFKVADNPIAAANDTITRVNT